jgi:hypothetical protein
MMPKPEVAGQCGCGRSPTGKCIGWHALTEDAYKEKLTAYNEAKKQEDEDLREWQRQAQELWSDSCTALRSK